MLNHPEIDDSRNVINFWKMRGFSMHNDFTMFKRAVPSGKKVVYYYAYSDDGVRRGPWTTGCITITEARSYCHRLIKNGLLVHNKKSTMTFGEFADGFWEEDSEYIQYQKSRYDISKNTLSLNRSLTKQQIVPFFGKMPLDKITDKDIDNWLLGFKNRGTKDLLTGEIKSFYKNSYANTSFSVFGVMLGEAVRQKLIESNPCDYVKRLKDDCKKMEILTVEEVRKLFPKENRSLHWDKEVAFAANFLASITGMRIGEVLGLRGEYVYDDSILICGQYGQFGYIPSTKTKTNRGIPLMPEMIAVLKNLMTKNGKGYLFSLDGGAAPVCRDYISDELYRALGKIGIGKDEIKRRGLRFHGWRHFLNTDLQRQGMTIQQVQGVTGHKSKRMTDWYSHLDARSIPDVVKAQETILGVEKKDKSPSEEKPNLVLIKKTEVEQQPKLKHA